jgi:hypothetical protein
MRGGAGRNEYAILRNGASARLLPSQSEEAIMLRRIGLWAFGGCAVALIWALIFWIFGPSNGEYPSQAAVLHYLGHTPLLPITAPVALLGRHYAITWAWSAVINAAIYVFIGLAIETIRLAVHSRRPRLRH